VSRTARPVLAAAILLTICAEAARGEEPALLAPPIRSSFNIVLNPTEPIPLPPVTGVATEGQLTMSQAESLAAARHPALREAEGLLRATQGNWVQVGLRPNPKVGYSGEEIGDSGKAGKQGGFFSQEIVTADKRGLNRSVASREVAAAEQRYELTRLQLTTSVRMYYYEALAAERAMALAENLSSIAAESVTVSDKRLQALEGSRAAVLQSQIESESASLLVEQATNRRKAAWRRLASLVGKETELPPALEDTLLQPLPELAWESTRDRILTDSPELAELRYNVERARWAVARARAGRVPNVDMEAGVAKDNVTGDTIASVIVSMPIPVFDRNQGAITQAGGELTAAQAALEQRELVLQERLATALSDYATARQRVAQYSEAIIPKARESLEIITHAYEQGELDYLQLLSIQQTFTEKNIAYLQDLEIAWKKWAEIDGLLVGPLPSGAE
jgi:outer membrane protein, heavy metal efflux system